MSPAKQSPSSLPVSFGDGAVPLLIGPAAILLLALFGAAQPVPALAAAAATAAGA
ncbi:ATPase, partial [Pseudomonas sp. HMWF010]